MTHFSIAVVGAQSLLLAGLGWAARGKGMELSERASVLRAVFALIASAGEALGLGGAAGVAARAWLFLTLSADRAWRAAGRDSVERVWQLANLAERTLGAIGVAQVLAEWAGMDSWRILAATGPFLTIASLFLQRQPDSNFSALSSTICFCSAVDLISLAIGEGGYGMRTINALIGPLFVLHTALPRSRVSSEDYTAVDAKSGQ